MKTRWLLVFAVMIVVGGCTKSTGVVPDGVDAFRVMHTGDTGFTNSATLQKNAYQEATTFCAQQGKIVETINMESKQARPFGGWPEATLLFRCVDQE
ncbi:hypothetical protein [Desulfopila sp. IMCC35008]|uniref:hypothetical protein n=1 Tax=Desulfopila sp. IMCC35008 TaxID=2653858 RepID=UPI0013D56493|nr:hypothetical protein [Desulfopila sp. IMCC35008]